MMDPVTLQKKPYLAPMLEIEAFELDQKIATGCDKIVNLGPGDSSHGICDDYDDPGEITTFSLRPGDHESPEYRNFYDACDCKETASDVLLFTS